MNFAEYDADILMVWHALLLNSSWFRSFNGRKLKRLYDTPFPWKAIVSGFPNIPQENGWGCLLISNAE